MNLSSVLQCKSLLNKYKFMHVWFNEIYIFLKYVLSSWSSDLLVKIDY